MEDFKKMFDGVYGWTVEAGKPTPLVIAVYLIYGEVQDDSKI